MGLLLFLIAFLASVVGAICGIGGGVIIKPVLDLLRVGSVSAINFYSGCTVLAMSLYSVGRSLLKREKSIDLSVGTALALGAAAGGVAGKRAFSLIAGLFADPERVSGVQAVCLGILTVGTLLYTVFKRRIATKKLTGKAACAAVGLLLGIVSSFLGIGGGPINLVVLYYLFSMDTKTAAANSLYIILFSQIASLLTTIVTGTVPELSWPALWLMAAGGIGGGVLGRALNRRMDGAAVEKLFLALTSLIVLICIVNACRSL